MLLHVTAMIFILLQKLLYHISKQCRPLSDIFSFIICLVSTLDLHCLSNSFIWVLDFIGLIDCVQIMTKCIFSALKVYASVNNLSVIRVFGRFMNFWMEPVLSRTYKVSSQMTQNIGPGESRTSGPSDTALGYIGDLQFKLLSYEKSLGKYIPLNTEGSVFELQSAKVSAITSSAKTTKSTVQISIRAATSIWAGRH